MTKTDTTNYSRFELPSGYTICGYQAGFEKQWADLMFAVEHVVMNLSKSIDFLLENAGVVIKYRLRKEILHDITQTEEENLLEQIYQTLNYNKRSN